MAPKRKSDHGPIYGGRVQFDRVTREVIRTYTRAKLEQAISALKKATEADERMKTKQSAGLAEYWRHVVSFLDGLYSQGQHSLQAAEWVEAWRIVSSVERHTGSAEPTEQQHIPGME